MTYIDVKYKEKEFKNETCIAVINSVKPRKPCFLESANAQTFKNKRQ